MGIERLPGQNPAAIVTDVESEALIESVARRAAGKDAGVFGPESLTWRINRESALFLGSARAALLQVAHPWVAAALVDHSKVLDQPIRRFHNTFRVVFTLVFGGLDQALNAARHLHALHNRIRGRMPEDVAGYRSGSGYEANELAALRWVFATLIETAVMAYECAMPPLTAAERERYYGETKTLAALFGVRPAALPETWDDFLAYNRAMHESDALGVSRAGLSIARNLLAGAGSWMRLPHWYLALTTAWMPARFREEFELKFGAEERDAAERALRWLPRIYGRLPGAVRFAGPWHEAQARLAGRQAGAVARWSNRFWIGETRMPFGGVAALLNNSVSPRKNSASRGDSASQGTR
ncbi:MAG: oxygenase MpaB family protein [Terracidiphilus sp.]